MIYYVVSAECLNTTLWRGEASSHREALQRAIDRGYAKEAEDYLVVRPSASCLDAVGFAVERAQLQIGEKKNAL